MSDEIDPNWPPPDPNAHDDVDPNWLPPQPKSTSDVQVNWPTTQPAVAPDVDPNWLPPSMPSDQTVLGNAPAPQPTPYPTTRQPPSSLTRRHVPSLALVAVLLGGMACIGVGAVITLLLVEQRSPQQTATPAASPTSVTQPTPSANAAPQPSAAVPPPPASQNPAAVTLQPNAAGDVPVRTESGKTRCEVGSDVVVCQYLPGFPQAPVDPPINCPPPPGVFVHCLSGIHWDLAAVTSAGAFRWNEGNIPGTHFVNDIVLTYNQTYAAQGWTIVPTEDGTRFTNDGTGHGMFVSIEHVEAF
jgi:hypothetical protein